ncbi:MAG: hypothetical protein KatS3mg102_0004 [Planctomycetota bacterium]|nr:MAG: hypothetical protein KatS3mg102_0004 [Planctomycetota bacterium]
MGGVRRRLAAGLALAAGLGLGMPGAWGQERVEVWSSGGATGGKSHRSG